MRIFAEHLQKVREKYLDLNGRRLVHETIRRMIHSLVMDLCRQSSLNIAEAGPGNIADIRNAPSLIGFSPAMHEKQAELKRFLRSRLYQHYLVNRMSAKARRTVRELFAAFMQDINLLPDEFQDRAYAGQDQKHQARAVADYIAGMTDRYAIREYRRLFAIEEQAS